MPLTARNKHDVSVVSKRCIQLRLHLPDMLHEGEVTENHYCYEDKRLWLHSVVNIIKKQKKRTATFSCSCRSFLEEGSDQWSMRGCKMFVAGGEGDIFNIGDDVILNILKRLDDPSDLKSASLVSRQWLRLEVRSHSSNLQLLVTALCRPDFVPRFFERDLSTALA